MLSKITKSIMISIVGSMMIFSTSLANNHSTGNAVVDARLAAMSGLGKNMKAIAAVAKGKAEYSEALNANAAAIAKIAAGVSDLFHEKVMIDKDRAKPEIWAKMGEFKSKADDLSKASEGLIAAVATGDQAAIGAALGATGKTCGGCHKPFRKPKE